MLDQSSNFECLQFRTIGLGERFIINGQCGQILHIYTSHVEMAHSTYHYMVYWCTKLKLCQYTKCIL